MPLRIWRSKDGAKLLQLFLHEKVGLRVGAELKSVFADNAEAVSFVETLSTRVVFPDAKPHHIAALIAGMVKTNFHQPLANALAEVLLMGVEPVEFDRSLGGYSGFDVVEGQLSIAGRFALYLGDQEDILFVSQLGGRLLKAKRLPHVVV